MKYYITFRVEALYTAEVEVEDKYDAIQKGQEAFSDADFGEAYDIDGELLCIENEKGVKI